MMARSGNPDHWRYDTVAAGLHWLVAALVMPLVLLGLSFESLGEEYGPTAIRLHKSLGLTVLGLTLLRIVWRLFHRPPPLPPAIPGWQKFAAHCTHWSLYALMILLPLSGYLLSSANPYPLQWFGIGLPKLSVSESVGEVANEFHVVAGILMAALLVVHIGAALIHQFVQKDRLVSRMNPFAASQAIQPAGHDEGNAHSRAKTASPAHDPCAADFMPFC